MSARLRSALTQLPLTGLPPRLLDVGCGAYPPAEVLRDLLPGWTLYGVDIDADSLRRAHNQHPDLHLIQADGRYLPVRATFGLILVRHPDLYRHRAAWSKIIPALPVQLAPGGILLIALYAPEEVEVIRAMRLPAVYPLDNLAPANLAGQDRYLLAFSPTPA